MRKRRRRSQITAVAMAFMMATGTIVSGPSMIASATEQKAATVKFPAVYSIDYVIPETNETIVNRKVEALLKTMTTEEKYTFLGGNGTGDSEGNAGYLKGVPRLGVPMIKMYDGPAGVLFTYDTTNPPQEQMLAATWNEEMAQQYGEAVGSENVAIGGSFLLGAQLDIMRVPQFGRTKDQMGEDPFLLSSLADNLVNGMQEDGGIAVLKHYAAFAQNATPGTNTNVDVSEQALHEVYLSGFESAVKDGNALGLMSSYNKINGTFASANTYLLEDVLRDMWGYKYFTITDWGGNDGYTLNKGTDIEMPSLSKNSQSKTEEQVAAGTMTREEADQTVDEAVRRILKAYGAGGYLTLVQVDEDGYAVEEEGRTEPIQPGTDADALADLYDSSNEKIQEVAEEGGVLLKNEDNTLPLKTSKKNTVAVIGLTGLNLASGIGGERSYGSIKAMTSPYEALTDILGEDKVEGQVYSDIIGEAIPAEYLYTGVDGEEHGVTRTYGVEGSPGTPIVMQGQTIYFGKVDPTPMGDHEVGEFCTTDTMVDFTTGTIDEEPNKTYFNSEDGTAFDYKEDPAYTWTTYVEAPESGDYSLIYEGIGGSGGMKVYTEENGVEKQVASVSGPTANQGTQWYSSIVPTETGMSISSATVTLEAGKRYKVVMNAASKVENKDMQIRLAWITPSQKEANYDNAIKAAETNKNVVVFAYAKVSDPAATKEKTTLKLDESQEKMILDVAKAAHKNGNKVTVVLNNDSAVVMENWIDEVDAILEMYYPGQRGGVATAKLLTGEVNPSGKLAYTIPKKDSDTIITYSDEAWEAYTTKDENGNTSKYTEGINTGYRWYDKMGIEPEFDFGYGLSYTSFKYSNIKVKENAEDGESVGYDVTFTIKNTGDVAGSEVAQVYLGEAKVPTGIESAKYQLAGYEKVKDLQPGEKRTVTIHISERSLSYWNSNQEELTVREDGTKDKWTVATGNRVIYVGSSSDQLLLDKKVNVTEDTKVSSIELNKTSSTMFVGDTLKLTATVSPTNATNAKVTWESSNKKVVKVDNQGKVTAVANGTATITATSTDGTNKTASCKIKVVKSKVELNLSSVKLFAGSSFKITAGSVKKGDSIKSWTSSNTKVATVSKAGKVTAKKQGQATITVKTVKGATAKCKVTVKKATVKLNAKSLTFKVGMTAKMKASAIQSGDSIKSWTSSNKKVAVVSKTGKITAKKAGKTKITVKTTYGATASCTVTVTKK